MLSHVMTTISIPTRGSEVRYDAAHARTMDLVCIRKWILAFLHKTLNNGIPSNKHVNSKTNNHQNDKERKINGKK